MEVKILSKEEINQQIASTIINLIKTKPNAVLGLATGSSPLGVYALLINAYKEGTISFKDITTFNLDEYVGLDETNNQSYRYYMNINLFDHIDIDKSKTNIPSGTGDIEATAKEYDNKIAQAGGIDLQILGLGSDCHIAFNEPGTPFDSLTHVTDIAESTIKDNARFFEKIEDVPTKAITMGLKSIMNAKKIVLIATGKNKAQAVYDMIKGTKDTSHPGSILRDHNDCVIYLDNDAASLL